MFNEGRYQERADRGELRLGVVKSGHPSPTRSGQPYCTRSQLVTYRDKNNNLLAMAHRYLRPDGTIGASGRPDPKRLYTGGIIYAVMEP